MFVRNLSSDVMSQVTLRVVLTTTRLLSSHVECGVTMEEISSCSDAINTIDLVKGIGGTHLVTISDTHLVTISGVAATMGYFGAKM